MHTFNNIDNATVQNVIDWAKQLIAKQSGLTFQSGALEARLLFSYVTGKSQTWLMTHSTDAVLKHFSQTHVAKYTQAVNERLAGKPIAFILGTQAFWSLNLKVSEHTLIPRQDTETLVEAALNLTLPVNAQVLDLGTGTGAIALALAKERPHWCVLGVDKVHEAVALARENAILNEVNAHFIQSDWFKSLDGHELNAFANNVFTNNAFINNAITNEAFQNNAEDATSDEQETESSNNHEQSQTFDLIVSNPPYVETNSDYVQQGDLRFEPLSALVSGVDGLDDIRHIIAQAPHYLRENGYLLIEHGHQQYLEVQALLQNAHFENIRSIADINNIQRITLGQRQVLARPLKQNR